MYKGVTAIRNAQCPIQPGLKRTLVAISERTGLSISMVTDEILYTSLVEIPELTELEERG